MLIGGIQKTSLIDYPKKIAAIVFTRGCNFRCPYCHNPELVIGNRQDSDDATFLNFLECRKGKLDGIVVTGGEPCIQEDLPIFLKNIKRKGFAIKLDTNGSQFEVLEGIIKENLVDYIAMDIKAPLSKYNNVTKTTVNTDDIKKSIDLIMNSGIEYEFRTTVVKSLLEPEDFDEIGKLTEGANLYFIQKFLFSKVLDKEYMFAKPFEDKDITLAADFLRQHKIKNVKTR